MRASTLRAWERRYGVPTPYRDPSGQRLYSERDIALIVWLREQTQRRVSISRAIAMAKRGQAGVGLPSQSIPSSDPGPPAIPLPSPAPVESGNDVARLRSELVRALLDFDPGRAETLVSEGLLLLSVEDLTTLVLEPALDDIGTRWPEGPGSVAEEHYASTFLRGRLSSLVNAYSATCPTSPVLAACSEGEHHEIGMLVVSLFLVRHGIGVRYLGPNLPSDQLQMPLERLKPDLVILSAHTEETLPGIHEVYRLIQTLAPPRPLLGFGGRIFNEKPSLRTSTPGVFLGVDARETLATVRRLLRLDTPAQFLGNA